MSQELWERMNEKNWINKSVCPTDKRLVDLELTNKGRAKLQELNTHLEGANVHLAKLSISEINQLNKLLDKIRN